MTDPEEIVKRDFSPDFKFTTSRSSGPGGQHVNKLETRVTLRFNMATSFVLSEEEKAQLQQKWAKKLNQEGELLIHAEQHRSQLKNKQECIKRFFILLKAAFTKPKPRKATKPTRASVIRRKEAKKKQAQKKAWRKPPDMD